MFHLPSTSLRTRLMLLVVLSMLPIFGLLMFHAMKERDRKLRERQDEAVRLAELAAGGVSQFLEGTRQMLLTLAHTDAVHAMDGPAASSLFTDLLAHSPSYLNIAMVRTDGWIIGSGVPLSSPVAVPDHHWFQRLRKTGNFAVSEYLVGKIINRPSLVLGFPLPGSPHSPSPGAVTAMLNLEALQACISRSQLPPHTILFAVDRNGIFLASNPGFDKWIGSTANSWKALLARGGSKKDFVEAIGLDNTRRIFHYTPVPGSDDGIYVAVGISKAVVAAESRAGLLHSLGWLGLSTGMSLAAAWFFGYVSVIRHVRRLTEASRRLARNDWNAQTQISGGALELQQLAQTFDAMAATLRRQNERLEGQVQTLNSLLPICSGCKKIRDDQGYWNQIELYISAHSGTRFSHGLCPECTQQYFPELDIETLEQDPPPPAAPPPEK